MYTVDWGGGGACAHLSFYNHTVGSVATCIHKYYGALHLGSYDMMLVSVFVYAWKAETYS